MRGVSSAYGAITGTSGLHITSSWAAELPSTAQVAVGGLPTYGTGPAGPEEIAAVCSEAISVSFSFSISPSFWISASFATWALTSLRCSDRAVS